VADGKAVTLFGASDGDFAAAFDTATGKEIWRYRLGAPHKGIDGSHDGPLSSPVLGVGSAFVLSPDGRLLALSLDKGVVAWEKQLATDLGGRRPHFGFTTTPTFADGVLVVLNGGPKGRSVVGLNPTSGATVWSFGDDKVDYQSPAFLTLAGTPQLVIPSATEILGVRPSTGDILWRHPLGENDRTANANPAPMGQSRFLLDLGGGIVAFEVSKADNGFAARELYRSRTLGGNYAPPIYLDGYVYGFRGQILTCMKAEDGTRVWRSREPGGDGLLLADGHLVIFGAKGNVVVAQASPDGYQEKARVQALEGSSLTWPSLADGKVFVRNLDRLAAVNLRSDGAQDTAASQAEAISPTLLTPWLRRMEEADEPSAVVDAFEKEHPNWPLVDGDRVHFLYRGEAQDVAILGSMLDSSATAPLERVAGTDLFYRTFQLDPATRWEYLYQVDFEKQVPDPKNSAKVPGLWGGVRSELVLDGYPPNASHLEKPETSRGSLETFTLDSKILGYEKEIQVWLPQGAKDAGSKEAGAGPYPLLLVQDGEAWLERGLMVNTLDNLVGQSVSPVVVAFIKPAGQWWFEAGGSRTDSYVRMLAEELVPALGERYSLSQDADSRAILGTRYFGLTSAYAALSHPKVFGKSAIMSPQLSLGAGEALDALIRSRAGSSVEIYLDWNRFGERQVDRGLDATQSARDFAKNLEGHGYSTTGGEVLDSFGWSGWRNRSDRVLTALFPIGAGAGKS